MEVVTGTVKVRVSVKRSRAMRAAVFTDVSICNLLNNVRPCNGTFYLPLSDLVVNIPKSIADMPSMSRPEAEAALLPYIEHIYISRKSIAAALDALDPFAESEPSDDPLGPGNALPIALIRYLPPQPNEIAVPGETRYLQCAVGHARAGREMNIGLRDLAWPRDYAHELPLPLNIPSRAAFGARQLEAGETVRSNRLYCLVVAYLQRFIMPDADKELGTTGWWDAWKDELGFEVTKSEDALAQMVLIVAFSSADKWRQMVRIGYRRMYERYIARDETFWPRIMKANDRASSETTSDFLTWLDHELEMMMIGMTYERKSKLPPVFSMAGDFLEAELNRQVTLLAELAKMTFVPSK